MRIVGNLDVEVTWARMDAAMRRARGEKAPSPDDPRFALPEPVMRKISAAATLLRVFAQSEDDVLWTPRPVEPSRMARVAWLPTPRLESGPVPESADVWWGERTQLAVRFNHRSFTQTQRELGMYPTVQDGEGPAVIRTLDELAARAADTRSWVAKAPLSAAGRLRVRGEGGPLGGPTRAQASRLLDLYGCLLFELWFDRTADFGAACSVVGRTHDMGIVHDLLVDPNGRFLGIATPTRTPPPQSLNPLYCALDVAEGLDLSRYQGPFGIDVFLVRQPDGTERLRLSEVNARHTFGHVANDLAAKARASLGLDAASPVTLRFGRGAPPPDTIPLLLPGTDDDTSAWLEVPSRHAG